MSLQAGQCRAARALLQWSQADLAQASKVATKTLADFERGQRVPYDRTLSDIQKALEAAGVEFIPENGGGPGVRLRKGGKRQDDHPKPAGPATDVVDKMDSDIAADRKRR